MNQDEMRPECMDCGEPATYKSADGVDLCEGDYQLLCERAAQMAEGDEMTPSIVADEEITNV